jgi:hypothetical protein
MQRRMNVKSVQTFDFSIMEKKQACLVLQSSPLIIFCEINLFLENNEKGVPRYTT